MAAFFVRVGCFSSQNGDKVGPKIHAEKGVILDRLFKCFWWALSVFGTLDPPKLVFRVREALIFKNPFFLLRLTFS